MAPENIHTWSMEGHSFNILRGREGVGVLNTRKYESEISRVQTGSSKTFCETEVLDVFWNNTVTEILYYRIIFSRTLYLV